MTQEGFQVTHMIAEVFFRYCIRYKVTGEKERTAVLRRLVVKKKAKYIPHPEEFFQGKKVVQIRRRKESK